MATLSQLVETSQALTETRSRKAKSAFIADWLRSLADHERLVGSSYVAGIVPQGRIGVGRAALHAARKAPAASAPSLELLDVDRVFGELAEVSGKGSTAARAELLGGLYSRATTREREFVTGLLSGSIRQGANAGVLIEAIAQATGVASENVRRAAMVAGDVAEVAVRALRGGEAALAELRITLFKPLSPMLAQPTDTIDEVFNVIDDDLALELKMDGARVQAHKDGSEVRLYSRRLRDVTASLPDVVRVVRALPIEQAILDGEAIALRADGRPERFQTTMSRFSKHEETPGGALSTFFFDCLLSGEDDLLMRPARERFAALEEAVPTANRIERIIPATREEAAAFARSATERGHEGVMAKSLSSVYRAGARGAQWLKIKPVHTLDLVVLGVEWGSGRRKGTLSNLHLGARDASSGEFVMLGKTFKGMTDKLLAWQTKELLARETHRDEYTVYVRPELVVEIAIGGVLASPRYPAGLALRFARVRRYRADKTADQADTIATVRAIYEAS